MNCYWGCNVLPVVAALLGLCLILFNYIHSFFRNVQGTIIMFDLTNEQSLLNALSDKENNRKGHTSWIKEVDFRAEDDKYPIKLLGEY